MRHANTDGVAIYPNGMPSAHHVMMKKCKDYQWEEFKIIYLLGRQGGLCQAHITFYKSVTGPTGIAYTLSLSMPIKNSLRGRHCYLCFHLRCTEKLNNMPVTELPVGGARFVLQSCLTPNVPVSQPRKKDKH